MEKLKEATLVEKVNALQKANPKLSDANACVLLGVTLQELDDGRREFLNNPFNSVFGFNF